MKDNEKTPSYAATSNQSFGPKSTGSRRPPPMPAQRPAPPSRRTVTDGPLSIIHGSSVKQRMTCEPTSEKELLHPPVDRDQAKADTTVRPPPLPSRKGPPTLPIRKPSQPYPHISLRKTSIQLAQPLGSSNDSTKKEGVAVSGVSAVDPTPSVTSTSSVDLQRILPQMLGRARKLPPALPPRHESDIKPASNSTVSMNSLAAVPLRSSPIDRAMMSRISLPPDLSLKSATENKEVVGKLASGFPSTTTHGRSILSMELGKKVTDTLHRPTAAQSSNHLARKLHIEKPANLGEMNKFLERHIDTRMGDAGRTKAAVPPPINLKSKPSITAVRAAQSRPGPTTLTVSGSASCRDSSAP